MTDAEEREQPLTFPDVRPSGRCDRSAGASIDCNDPSHRGVPEDIGADNGCANYQPPRRFRAGKYSGYTSLSTLSRVSMHDSWEIDASTATGEGDGGGYRDNASADSDSDGECNGEFVSFWGHNKSRDSDSGDSGSSCSGDGEEQAQPQHLLHAPEESDGDGDRVETTMRRIPLLYRKYQGGLGQIAIGDPSRNNFGSWFQRELGVANLHFNEKDLHRSRKVHRQWGFGRMRRISLGSFDDGQDEGDANSLLGSSSSDDVGMCIPAQMSPLAYDRAMAEASRRHRPGTDNIFGWNDRRGILDLPIVKPFLRGTNRGFTDDADADPSNEVDDNSCDEAGDWPSRRDRADVVKSIAQGIAGSNDNSLLLDPAGGDTTKQSAISPPPNLLERIFLTRFLQPPGDNRNNRRSIIQLHNLLRKEDWALATTLLQSKPELAQTWHNITRLYGGRYDGEALPIHAACALRPPPAFVEMLVNLYPEGRMKKDKAFGRVPLHVACRSLAESTVIRVLCAMDPTCVEARDSLKRVPLHYHIKNSHTLGEDDDDRSVEDDSADTTNETEDDDGIKALKALLDTSPGCVHAADHRGWIPLHVACSCSSRKGMLRVMRLLLEVWPESLNAITDKGSDVFACVEMAGEHHPTKQKVLALLKEAKGNLDREGTLIQDDNSEGDNGASVATEERQFEENERCSSSDVELLALDGN